MADEENGRATLADLSHALTAFDDKITVPRRQRFVDDQNLGSDADRRSESKSRLHPGGIGLKGLIDDIGEFGKADNPVEFASYVVRRHPKTHRAEEDIVASGIFRMEAGAELEYG